jgi:hypothetical protein
MSSRLPLLAGEQLYEAQSDFEGKGKNQLNFRKKQHMVNKRSAIAKLNVLS